MKNSVRTLVLLLGDIITLVISFFVMIWSTVLRGHDYTIGIQTHTPPFIFIGIMWILFFFLFNLYDTQTTKPTIPHLQQISIAFAATLIASILLFYLVPSFNITPKTNLIIFSTASIILFISWRRIFYIIFSKYFRKKAIFIINQSTQSHTLDEIINYINTYPQSGFIVGPTYTSAKEFIERNENTDDVIVIAIKDIWREPANAKMLASKKYQILDLADAYEDMLGRIPTETIDNEWFVKNVHPTSSVLYKVTQKCLGIFVAIVALVLLSPLLALISIIIKLSDGGPIFYSQERVGRYGEKFNLYKLRSMKTTEENTVPKWAETNDPRITPVGKILRRLHVDEIPQMLNILKGDLALVGPRPEQPLFVSELEEQIPFYYLRHNIAPGFTGWAQIKFRYARSVMDSKEKFEYDLYYIKNRNIFMDIGIILRTIQIIFRH